MTNADIATIFCVLTVVGMTLVGLLLLRMQRGWPEPGLKRDEFLRRRLGLAPRRRLLSHLHLPRLRLRR